MLYSILQFGLFYMHTENSIGMHEKVQSLDDYKMAEAWIKHTAWDFKCNLSVISSQQ